MKTEYIILLFIAIIAVISLSFAINTVSFTGKSTSHTGVESLNPYNIGDVLTVNITEGGTKYSGKTYYAQYSPTGLARFYPIFVNTNATVNDVQIKIVALGESYAVADIIKPNQ